MATNDNGRPPTLRGTGRRNTTSTASSVADSSALTTRWVGSLQSAISTWIYLHALDLTNEFTYHVLFFDHGLCSCSRCVATAYLRCDA